MGGREEAMGEVGDGWKGGGRWDGRGGGGGRKEGGVGDGRGGGKREDEMGGMCGGGGRVERGGNGRKDEGGGMKQEEEVGSKDCQRSLVFLIAGEDGVIKEINTKQNNKRKTNNQ